MIEKAVLISAIVFAIHYTMKEGEIFEKLGDWLFVHFPKKLHSPIFECPVCMCPWYGTILYWAIWGCSVKEWLVVIIAAMGLNSVIVNFFPKDDIKKY